MNRKMFFFERLMYVDGRTPVNCLMTARIHGEIAAENLRSALEKVQGKHPLLRASVVEGPRPYFAFSANPQKIPVRVIERRGDEDWRDMTVLEWKTPFNMNSGPMVRMVWIKSEGVSELMLVGHHCICDGASLFAIVREILQLIDQPDMQLTPKSITEKIDRLNAYEHLMAAEQLHTSVPKLISLLRKSKGSYDFAFSNVGRLDIPENYQTFQVESFLGVTVAVPWRKRHDTYNDSLSRADGPDFSFRTTGFYHTRKRWR